jgi:hypothetical protein
MSPEDSAFATAVPIGEMNTKMKLRVAKELEPELKIDSSVALILENLSKEEIGFQGRYGLRIFVYSTPGEEWIEVKDRYPPYIKNPPPLDPQGGDFSEMVINVRPVLTNEGKPITVRILVVGTIYRNGAPTAEEVGAYTEVVLNP